jgi:hypothetical protein
MIKGVLSSSGTKMGRSRAKLGINLDRNLLAYAVTASAAGVSLLALAQPAEAKIVYAKANSEIAPNATLNLDLNHDGIVDFKFSNPKSRTISNYRSIDRLTVGPEAKNEVMNRAGVLPAGESVGRHRSFRNSAQGMVTFVKYGNRTRTYTTIKGLWQNITGGYLGLKFFIRGLVHYGWARFNVTVTEDRGVYALLTGYAYETVANKAILTGKTKGDEDEIEGARENSTLTLSPQPEGSLGQLARGVANVKGAKYQARGVGQ